MRRIISTVVAVAALMLVIACGRDDGSDNAAASAPTSVGPKASTAPEQPPPSSAMASIQSAVGIPPAPDAATQAKYIAGLNSINPKIVDGKEERAVDRGRNVCRDLAEKKDHATVINNVQTRFGSGTLTITEDQAESMFAVINAYLCPKS